MFIGGAAGIAVSAGMGAASLKLTVRPVAPAVKSAVASPTITFSLTSENTSLAVTTPFTLPPTTIAVPPTKPAGRPGSGSLRLLNGTPFLVGVLAKPVGTLIVMPMTVIVLAVISLILP